MTEEIKIILKNGEPHSISDFDVKETIDILNKAIDKLKKCLQANMLEPCPFCGAETSTDDIHCVGIGYNDGNFLSQVICTKCGAGGPVNCERENAAKHWNARKQKGNENETI